MNGMGTFVKSFEREATFVTRRIGGETIIVPVRGGVGDLKAIYTLNDSGTGIWQMIREGKPVSQIVNEICQEYEVSAEEVTQDLVDFMCDLRGAGLIHSYPENGG